MKTLVVVALSLSLLFALPTSAQVAANASAYAGSVRIQNIPSEEMWKRVTQCVFPTYPGLAFNSHIAGTVDIGLGISPEGEVANYRVLVGHPLLVQPAVDAIRQWKFRPNVVQGEVTWSRVRALIRFNADGTTAVGLAPGILADNFGDPGTPRSAANEFPRPVSAPECKSEQPWAGAEAKEIEASEGATGPQPSKLAPLVYEGRQLTTEQATALEEQLKTSPEDLAARARLLGYYFTIAKNQIGVPATIAARRRHILWLIEHHPESEITGLSESTLDVSGHDLADKEGFEQARALWLKEMDLHKDSADVMINAAMFFKLPDKALAVQAAERAHEIEPANPERTALLSFTYAMTILGVSQMSNTGIPGAVNLAEEQGTLAQSIIAKLDKSQNAALLGETGGLIAQDGMMVTKLHGLGPSDLKVDYLALSEKYLQRAADLDPLHYSFGLGHMYSMRADADETATPEQRATLKKKALGLEYAALERNPDAGPIMMNEVCRVALEVNDVAKAQSCAERMLARAEALKEPHGVSGDDLNKAHNFVGRVALRKGDLKKAKQELLAAGNVPGDGTLTSFGPNMALAKDLLEKGEHEVVFQYFELCEKIWPYGSRQLAAWKLAVQRDELPQFGANLIY